MSQQTADNSNPILPAVVMFGALGVLMFAMLGSNPPRVIQIPPTVEVMLPTATPFPTDVPTVEAVVPTPWLQTIDATDGETLFLQACASCHGAEGEGVENVGPALQTSALLNDEAEDLVRFITSDQPLEIPYEGFTHPYRGGYPVLTDDQIEALAEYVRTFGAAG